MKTFIAFAALLALGAAQDDEQARKIQDLVKQLGADEFAAREKAGEELRKIGRPALDALRKAAESEDPEVRTRARGLVGEIEKSEEKQVEVPKTPQTPRRPARPVPDLDFSGGSVSIMTSGDSTTYKITPGDGSPPIAFQRTSKGPVKLDYTDEKGQKKSVEAESLEKFLKDHKEIAARYSITERGIAYGGIPVRFKGGFQPFSLELPGIPEQPAPRSAAERAGGATLDAVPETVRAQFEIPAGQGVLVTAVEPGGGAEATGLRRHDVLLEIDGKRISSPADVKAHLKKSSTVTVLRKGRRETLGASSERKKDF